ncbi:hypothetical protein SAMN04488509_102259 [Aquimonas voraii]|uniref:Uncharacterized protein n=1 Tax=Aquimonas voraii TaxID=265719 RepID=A0A1G6UBA8_9GAMM|nr:hypothetical protein SAMN04488509_102259 [Aquimonas voraii]
MDGCISVLRGGDGARHDWGGEQPRVGQGPPCGGLRVGQGGVEGLA